ncbi:Fic/DOC family N-terminal domain-containing protein [Vallitalea guaymasensis]|uniref:Fic/DOC N-terminal domain-containing protein n=1 Tax=Vallitalea guaymasensis TaxID=1185412 RepID=A0A8J8SAG1_9FIRM|nr:Fic/DOC family N-terminal domain-containing protein [Vallitalea guaymasensis]QUH27564.1 hypothetical protein HYG85_00965 [Vallitalea guaymasensis]
MKDFILTPLPPSKNLESNRVLKQLASSHRALAELNGYANIIPNKNILINAVTINEAKDSSEIENIVTTHDELYKAMAQKTLNNSAGKEVVNYRSALWYDKSRTYSKVSSLCIVQFGYKHVKLQG